MKIIWREHAQWRMAERSIEPDTVMAALAQGEVIRYYVDDKPYPSRLILHWTDGQPLHVVAAMVDEETEIIITAYHPDPALWEPDFKRKRL